MTITYEFKEQGREVPPYNPSTLGYLPSLVLGMAVLAFIGLATWVIMAIMGTPK